jgi:hypothetical protein
MLERQPQVIYTNIRKFDDRNDDHFRSLMGWPNQVSFIYPLYRMYYLKFAWIVFETL